MKTVLIKGIEYTDEDPKGPGFYIWSDGILPPIETLVWYDEKQEILRFFSQHRFGEVDEQGGYWRQIHYVDFLDFMSDRNKGITRL
jgi:hypothetical protein